MKKTMLLCLALAGCYQPQVLPPQQPIQPVEKTVIIRQDRPVYVPMRPAPPPRIGINFGIGIDHHDHHDHH